MGRNVYAFIQPKETEKAIIEKKFSAFTQAMPQKCKDLRTFVIPCTIGDNKFKIFMMDLGASINVMPTSVYKNLDFGPLQNIGLTIQLENISNARPAGVV